MHAPGNEGSSCCQFSSGAFLVLGAPAASAGERQADGEGEQQLGPGPGFSGHDRDRGC